MLEKISNDLMEIINVSQHNSLFVAKIIAFLWVIQLINLISGYRLNLLGIYPRTKKGLIGIITCPFLHGNFGHLFFNSIPLFVLSCLILLKGQVFFCYLSVFIIIISGLLTWLLGRRAVHIGASSVIMGYFGFLLSQSYLNFSASSVITAIVCLYYFGGMLFSFFPSVTGKNVSWEGHLFGFISGIMASFIIHYFYF